MKLDLSPQGWGRVVLWTIAGTAFCVFASIYVDSFNFDTMDDARRLRSIAVDIVLPTVLAVPLILFFTSKLRELAIAHARLTVYASTDSLTSLMNRAAFSTLVEAYLDEVRARHTTSGGAMLIIDADNFKAVNDHFGHHSGDEALIMIAHAIKSILRSPDLVGRIGGEEFGVFLPGASPQQAELVAERIRQSVSSVDFSPSGRTHRLTVSVGGAVFDKSATFSDLFRTADQQLYLAKNHGRNRVSLAATEASTLSAAA